MSIESLSQFKRGINVKVLNTQKSHESGVGGIQLQYSDQIVFQRKQ